MTQGGYDALNNELKRLKSVERPEVIEAIAEARAHGDLSENAEYHAVVPDKLVCDFNISILIHDQNTRTEFNFVTCEFRMIDNVSR